MNKEKLNKLKKITDINKYLYYASTLMNKKINDLVENQGYEIYYIDLSSGVVHLDKEVPGKKRTKRINKQIRLREKEKEILMEIGKISALHLNWQGLATLMVENYLKEK